jgi:hypothetical protein
MATASTHRAEITKCIRDVRTASSELQSAKSFQTFDIVQVKQRQLNQAQAKYKATLEHIGNELHLAVNEVSAAYSEIVAQNRAVMAANAETNSQLLQWRSTSDDANSRRLALESLLRSQQRVLQNERGLLVAEVAYNVALVKTKQVDGTLLAWHNQEISEQALTLSKHATPPVEEQPIDPIPSYTPSMEELEVLPAPQRPPESPETGKPRPLRRSVPRVSPPVATKNSNRSPRVARKPTPLRRREKPRRAPAKKIPNGPDPNHPLYPWSVPAPPAASPIGFWSGASTAL